MKIVLICFGSPSPAFIREGLIYYQKKIQPYLSLEIIEKELKTSADEEVFLNRFDNNNSLLFLLSEEGRQFTSLEFARSMQQWFLLGKKQLVFVVGSAYGFHESLKKKHQLLSLSQLTFNHHLARLVLVEQLYRSLTIIHRHPYHH